MNGRNDTRHECVSDGAADLINWVFRRHWSKKKTKNKTKNISQGFLFGDAPTCHVNDSTSISPLENENIPKEGEVHEHTGWNPIYLGLFPQHLPNMWPKPLSRQKRDNFYALLKLLMLPPPRPSVPARLECSHCTTWWVFIAVLSLTSWNSALQTQAGSYRCNSLGGKKATHSTFQWRWSVEYVGIKHTTGPQNKSSVGITYTTGHQNTSRC